MRLDHLAYRVAQGKRDEAAEFFIKAFSYKIQEHFEIPFDDEGKDIALCVALEPPEKVKREISWLLNKQLPWKYELHDGFFSDTTQDFIETDVITEYHLAPEIFISQGSEGSIVDNWVKSRGGFGGIHHLAYQVPDGVTVEEKMKEWIDNGWGSFTSSPIRCEGLVQVFSKPNVTGVIYEFLKREPDQPGFCSQSVKKLMIASKSD